MLTIRLLPRLHKIFRAKEFERVKEFESVSQELFQFSSKKNIVEKKKPAHTLLEAAKSKREPPRDATQKSQTRGSNSPVSTLVGWSVGRSVAPRGRSGAPALRDRYRTSANPKFGPRQGRARWVERAGSGRAGSGAGYVVEGGVGGAEGEAERLELFSPLPHFSIDIACGIWYTHNARGSDGVAINTTKGDQVMTLHRVTPGATGGVAAQTA